MCLCLYLFSGMTMMIWKFKGQTVLFCFHMYGNYLNIFIYLFFFFTQEASRSAHFNLAHDYGVFKESTFTCWTLFTFSVFSFQLKICDFSKLIWLQLRLHVLWKHDYYAEIAGCSLPPSCHTCHQKYWAIPHSIFADLLRWSCSWLVLVEVQ